MMDIGCCLIFKWIPYHLQLDFESVSQIFWSCDGFAATEFYVFGVFLSVTLFLLKSVGGCVSFKLCLYFRRQTLVFSCSWRRSTTVARAKRMRFLFLLQKVIKRMSFYFFPKRYLFVLFDQKTQKRENICHVYLYLFIPISPGARKPAGTV